MATTPTAGTNVTSAAPAAGTAPATATASEPTPPTPSFNHPPEAQRLITVLQTVYTSKDTKLQDEAILSNYSSKATFIDNLVHVSGAANVKVQFHALAKMLRFVTLEPTESKVEPADGNKKLVTIENRQSYGVGSSTIKLNVQTTLLLDEAGKIERHIDTWHDRWGQFGLCKRLLGSTSSVFLRLLRV